MLQLMAGGCALCYNKSYNSICTVCYLLFNFM